MVVLTHSSVRLPHLWHGVCPLHLIFLRLHSLLLMSAKSYKVRLWSFSFSPCYAYVPTPLASRVCWPILWTGRIAGFAFPICSDSIVVMDRTIAWSGSSSDHGGVTSSARANCWKAELLPAEMGRSLGKTWGSATYGAPNQHQIIAAGSTPAPLKLDKKTHNSIGKELDLVAYNTSFRYLVLSPGRTPVLWSSIQPPASLIFLERAASRYNNASARTCVASNRAFGQLMAIQETCNLLAYHL